MANYRLTSNLKLRIESTLTANARYNLERLDTLGGSLLPDNTDTVRLRSRGDVSLLPNNPDIGGTGSGGSIALGEPNQLASSIISWSADSLFPAGLKLKTLAGSNYLALTYNGTDISLVDTVGSKGLTITPVGNRQLSLESDLTVTSNGSITLSSVAGSSVTLPASGTLATLAGNETLTNKTINALFNTVTNITNVNVGSSAGIVYSKLNLIGSLQNTDVATSAGIEYSKLDLGGQVTGNDIASNAAISYSKLALNNSITNADIVNEAAIDGAKIDPDFGTQLVITAEGYRLSNGSYSTDIKQATSGQVSNVILTLPNSVGLTGQLLQTDGSGNLSWATVARGNGEVGQSVTIWSPSDGTTKIVTHLLDTVEVDVTVQDVTTGELILVSSIKATSNTTVELVSSEIPPNNWRVIIHG